jgi:hypothetical protein
MPKTPILMHAYFKALGWKILVYHIHGHLVHFGIHIVWPFDIFVAILVQFSPFGFVSPRKIWQPFIRSQLVLSLISQQKTLFDTKAKLSLLRTKMEQE